jgi:hypothetical protein
MHIQGHSATDGRHSAGRQQDRVRNATEKEQGRHIRSVYAHAEVQAQFGAVTGRHRSDRFAARHNLAG